MIETGTGGAAQGVDVMEINRPCELGDIASLGLTLAEAKQLLTRVQQAVVAAQSHEHAVLRRVCPTSGGRCHIKDWRLHEVATLFGKVAVRLPRFRCAGCGRTETCISWPPHCRSTPELDQLRAHLSALVPYRVAAGVLVHLLPAEAGKSPRRCVATRLKSASISAPSQRSSRRQRPQVPPSPLTRPSSVAAAMANGIWRFASVTSRRPREAGGSSALLQGPIPTSLF